MPMCTSTAASLFNGANSTAEVVKVGRQINCTKDELQRIWKESVVIYLKILSNHTPGGGGKTTKINLSHDNRSLDQDSNLGLPNMKQGSKIRS